MREKLLLMADEKMQKFNASLMPGVPIERILGIKTAPLRAIAAELYGSGEYVEFTEAVPHKYFEENQIHAFVISYIKDFDECIKELKHFLPYVDNWATCDQMNPKVFAKNRERLLPYALSWLESEHTYTVRFGIVTLMRHFISAESAMRVADIVSEEYYVNMARAWFFAEALSDDWEGILPFIRERRLDKWTHNKAIAKANDSRKISPERKKLLKEMKI